jgi:hypothetical protein
MHVIVLGGMARVGKTDAADFIEDEAIEAGMRPYRVSFATPLKEEAAKENGYGNDWRKFKKEQPEKYRDYCQEIGAEARAGNEDYWVDLWVERLNEIQEQELDNYGPDGEWEESVVIVDDCRYPNELDAAKMFNALTMFIFAGGRASSLPEMDAPWRAHESEEMSQKIEAMLEDYNQLFDWAIFNDGTFQDLQYKLQDRINYILGLNPSRFGNVCQCPECISFRSDIQAFEIIDSFREALAEIMEDPDLSDEDKETLRENFEELIEDLEEGRRSPMDLFKPKAWDKDEEDDDDEDANDCDS